MRPCQYRSVFSPVFPLALLAVSNALAAMVLPTAQAQSIAYTPNWVLQSPATVPHARYAESIAYDAATGQLVMFGGAYDGTGGISGLYETWTWNGSNWTKQATPANLTLGYGSSMAYDAATGQLVLFGGIANQTWTWNGMAWTQQTPPNSPSARLSASMAYDAASQQLVLFGGLGFSSPYGDLNDTWVWNGTTWILQNPAHSPSAREGAAMAYDAAMGQIVLFGGAVSSSFGDTWTWNGTDWTQQFPITSPPAQGSGAMAYDPALGELVFLGYGSGTNTTWLWNSSNWAQLSLPGGPPNANSSSMDYDAATGQIVFFGGYASSGNQDIVEGGTYTFGSVNLGNANICAASATTPSPCNQTATLNFTVGPTAQTVSRVNVLTQGAPGLDFTEVRDTCTQSLAASATCTVTVSFAPQHPGLRIGSVSLTGSNGNILGSVLLQGIGTGPQVTYSGAATPINPLGGAVVGQGYDGAIAVSATGTVFVSSSGTSNALLLEMTPNCASAGCVTAVGSFTGASAVPGSPGVAVDGAGNAYMTNSAGIYEIPSGCTTSACAFVLPASYTSSSAYIPNPAGIAVDGFGNLYVSGGVSASSLYEIPAGCANFSCVLTLGSGFNFNGAAGLAVDQNENIYVASSAGNAVYEVPGGCTLSTCVTTLASGFNSPMGVAVDAAGDVYIADNSQTIKEVSAGGSLSTISTGAYTPAAIAVDSSGNLYFVPQTSTLVYEIPFATSPAISFPTVTLDGTVDIDGTQTVTLANNGNAPLIFAVPTTGTNPAVGPDFTFNTTGSTACPALTTSTRAAASLASGATCTLPLTFTPVIPAAGALSETLTLTDNNLNKAAATQSLSLSGSSKIGAPTVTSVNPASGTAAGGVVAQIVGTNFANVTGIYFGAVQATVDAAAGGVSPTSLYVLVPPGTGGATVDVTVQTAQGTSATSTADRFFYTSLQTIGSFSPPLSATFGQAPISLMASGGPSGNPITFKVNSGPGSISPGSNQLTITGAGTIFVEADQAGNATYAAAAPVTASIIVGKATPTLTWATPAGITYGTALSATQLNAQVTGVTAATLAGTLTYTPSLNTILSAGSAQALSVSFTPSDTADYATATASVRINVSQAVPVIAWAAPSAITYGAALSATQLRATASVPGTFQYTPANGSIPAAGTDVLSVTFMPTDSVDYTTAIAHTSLTVNPATPSITWPAPSTILYGAALTAAQLDATASTPGTFTYTPALGTVLAAGPHTLSVTFTPTDSNDFVAAGGHASLTVNQAALTISANSTNRVFGSPNPIFTGTISGTVNGDTLTESFSTSATASSLVGSYPIIPSVTGANLANYAVTPVNGSLTVSQAGTGTTFTLSNQNLTLTATVVSLTSGTPTGNVGFYEGQTLVGMGTLSNGVASYTSSSFPSGDVVVTAEYSGDANFTQSQSPPILFLTIAPTATSLSVARTGSVADALAVSVAPGYTGTVQFACAGLPANSTCSFTPASVAFTGTTNTSTVTMTVQTTVNASLSPPTSLPSMQQRAFSFATIFWMPGLLLAAFARRNQKLAARLRMLWVWLLLGCLASGITACAGSSGSSGASGPSLTPAGSVNIQVLASGPGGLAQTTNLTLTVQ